MSQNTAIITVCASANFYRQAVAVQAQLEEMGYKATIPITAERMKESGNFDVSNVKTWRQDASHYPLKTALMRQHFAEIENGDAVLVLNYEKHGVQNYIGGNVLMEMTLGFYLDKPIFILNEVPSESPFLEELFALQPIVLHGNLTKLTAAYRKLSTL